MIKMVLYQSSLTRGSRTYNEVPMSLKSLTMRLLKYRGWVTVSLIILSVIVTRLLWERWILLRNLTQIEQTLGAFDLALKEQDVDLAYAQCLPSEYGGILSRDAIYSILNSHNKYIFPLHLRTEVAYYWRSKIRPVRIGNQIILEANVIGRSIFNDSNVFYFRAILRKWDNRWYIVSFPIP